jgi:DNA-binding NarL/FixJ family response regulator
MKQTILLFCLLTLGTILLFQVSKYTLFVGDLNVELMLALIAVVFFFIGVYLNKRSFQAKGNNEASSDFVVDYHKIKALHISDREYEVLQALSQNLTNKEIAEQLFISESTTKSHVSRLLTKLDASNRIKVVEKAKSLQIL